MYCVVYLSMGYLLISSEDFSNSIAPRFGEKSAWDTQLKGGIVFVKQEAIQLLSERRLL